MNNFGNFNNGSNFSGSNFGGGFAAPDTSFGDFGNQNMLQQSYNFGLTPSTTDAQGAITIEIRKVYMGATRPQADQFRRSYDVVLDGNGLNAIQEEVAQAGASAFDTVNMGSLMAKGADFIRHSGTADHAVGIENGWDQERFRFTMVVDVFRNGKFKKTEFISGSTDHLGASNVGLISTVSVDPQMLFTINHVTEAQMRQTDSMGRPISLVSRSNGVVRNSGFDGLGSHENMYMTRPSDVLRAVDKVSLYRGMKDAASFESDDPTHTFQDLDSMLTKVPMCSADTNLLIPTFASRTLKGLYENSLNAFDPMNMDNQGPGAMAGHRVADTAFSSSSFVHVMNRLLANGVTTTAQFTYSDLLRLDPTIDDRADIFGRSYETGSIVIPDGRQVCSMGAAETIAVHATSISHTTLALMSLSGVATLAYNANNLKTGQTEVVIQACDGMDHDGMLFQRLEALKTRLMLECLNIVSMNDEITYELDVFADAFNDVYIQFTWDGVRRDYVIPAFASSSLSPLVTNSLSRLTGMAEAIDQVVDTCRSLLNPGGYNNNNDVAIQGNGEGRFAGLAGDY